MMANMVCALLTASTVFRLSVAPFSDFVVFSPVNSNCSSALSLLKVIVVISQI